MRLWDLSIRRPVTVFMGLVSVLVIGAISYQQLKLAFLPKVDFPGLFVNVIAPNQNPLILEKEVTRPLEEAFATLQGVQRIQSNTGSDNAGIFMRFKWGMELDLIRLELGLKVEEVRPTLPDYVQHIEILNFNTEDIPVVEGRISAPGIDLSENYDLLEKHIKQKIERYPGVAKVELGGVLPKEVSIELKLGKIQEHGIDVGPLIEKLSKDNVVLSAGKIRTKGISYNVRSLGKIETLEEFENLRVNDKGVVLSDIADVLYEEPPIGYRRHLNMDKALALTVYKESTANTVDVARGVRDIISNEIGNDPVLKGISLFVWQDQAKEITSALDSLTESGLYGAIFAILVLYFFLRRITATLIVATAIPVSIIGSFIFLYAMDYTLNVLTLMGLMLAVGMLVDNAVVVIESIYQKSLEGKDSVEATKEGTREVITALIAATATTIIIFLALVIADDNQLAIWLKAIGVTISLTLTMSLMVSTLVIPLFASRILKKTDPSKAPKELWIVKVYRKVIFWTLDHPWKTFVILVVVLISTAFPFMQVQKIKGGTSKTQRLFVRYDLKDFFFLSEVEDVVDQFEAYVDKNKERWGIVSIYSYMEANRGETTLTFEDPHMPYERYKEIRKEMREGFPEIGGVSFRFEDDETDSSQAIRVQLFGSESLVLKQVGAKIAELLEGVEGLQDVRNGENSGKKELRVSVDREKANQYGVNPERISQIFGFTLGATYLPRFRQGERETDVTLGLRIEDRATIQDISQLTLQGGVKMGTIANFQYHDRPESIRRVDRKSHHQVLATYEGENLGDMRKEVATMLDEFPFPPGVTWSWSNRILQEQDQMSGMVLNIILALLLVYLVMASLYESLVQPLLILSSMVFALVGVYWLMFITQTEMNVMAVIGLFILLGIVVNNGIIMMDRINQLHRDEGMPMPQAVREGASQRIRPILMTASTTIIGMLPLALGNSGLGGSYYFPLARAVIGGLASSTMLTLIGLPFVVMVWYHLWEDIKGAFRWVRAKLRSRKNRNVSGQLADAVD